MKNLLFVLIVICVLIISGCGATVETYTFEVERTDQALTGNRGYISGEAPEQEAKAKKSTRTWVGIDIELPTGEEFIEETGLKFNK